MMPFTPKNIELKVERGLTTGAVPEVTATLDFPDSRTDLAAIFTLVATASNAGKPTVRFYTMDCGEFQPLDDHRQRWYVTARAPGWLSLPNISRGALDFQWSVKVKVTSRSLAQGLTASQIDAHALLRDEQPLDVSWAPFPVRTTTMSTRDDSGAGCCVAFPVIAGLVTVAAYGAPPLLVLAIVVPFFAYVAEFYFTKQHLFKDLTVSAQVLNQHDGLRIGFHSPSGNQTYLRGKVEVVRKLGYVSAGAKPKKNAPVTIKDKIGSAIIAEDGRNLAGKTTLDFPTEVDLFPSLRLPADTSISYEASFKYRRTFWLPITMTYIFGLEPADRRPDGLPALPFPADPEGEAAN